jgi:hypothetical protein
LAHRHGGLPGGGGDSDARHRYLPNDPRGSESRFLIIPLLALPGVLFALTVKVRS